MRSATVLRWSGAAAAVERLAVVVADEGADEHADATHAAEQRQRARPVRGRHGLRQVLLAREHVDRRRHADDDDTEHERDEARREAQQASRGRDDAREHERATFAEALRDE